MAFQQHGNQEVQNRKILQDIQEKKRQMMINQQGGAGNSGSTAVPSTHVSRPSAEVASGAVPRMQDMIIRNPNEAHQLAVSQRQALEVAQTLIDTVLDPHKSLGGDVLTKTSMILVHARTWISLISNGRQLGL